MSSTKLWSTMGCLCVVLIAYIYNLHFEHSTEQPDLDWWQKSIIYQIYPRSFKDTDNDGIGNLKGITESLDYLLSIGVNAIWINPIYESANLDFGYDVINHKKVAEEYGTMTDFKDLITAAHQRGIYIILDFVPNGTSDKHKWFEESTRGGSTNSYADYYIWHKGKQNGANREPPNNWLSCFESPAWTWNERRQAYYFHQYLPEQPDLNLRNEAVLRELEDTFKFWLDMGVDGFRIDASRRLLESENLKDELPSGKPGTKPGEYRYLEHNETMFHPDNYGVMKRWRRFLDEYAKNDKRTHTRLIIPQAKGSMEQVRGFYEYENEPVAHMPLNFNLVKLGEKCDARCLSKRIGDWLDMVPLGRWSNWRTDNHDHHRLASIRGREFNKVAIMLILTLPGTPIIYYGQEIGMVGAEQSFEDTKDLMAFRLGKEKYKLKSRDPERTPMQWNANQNAGFSNASQTWLPVAPDFKNCNVRNQLESKGKDSTIYVFKNLASLRQEPSLLWGTMEVMIGDDKNIYAYLRRANGYDAFVIIVNFGRKPSKVRFEKDSLKSTAIGTIAASTLNIQPKGNFIVGEKIDFNNLKLSPGEGLVIRVSSDEFI